MRKRNKNTRTNLENEVKTGELRTRQSQGNHKGKISLMIIKKKSSTIGVFDHYDSYIVHKREIVRE